MTESANRDEITTSIVALYRGPLDEFVTRRADLVKQLRAARQREAADRVKALRKPSRMAWVLDSIAHEEPTAIERLDAALQQAQTSTDLRAALEHVKAAVRDVAAIGARVAVRSGQPVEPSAVVAALYAVIGDTGALTAMRAGSLTDVPDAGGLDMLVATVREQPRDTGLAPSATSVNPAPATDGHTHAAAPDVDADTEATRVAEQRAEAARQRAARAEAARMELRQAEAALADTTERSRIAVRAVADAEREVDAAERAVQHAESEARARGAALERAQAESAAAAAALQDATLAMAAARARAEEL